jgi:hypothetical protein
MKAIYIILTLMILLPFSSLAKETVIKNDIRKYKTELNLTTQQMNQLNTIYNNIEVQKKFANPKATHEEIKQMRIERRQQLRSDLSKVLTKEQGIKLKAIRQANKAKK